MRTISFEPWDRRSKSTREKCLFAAGIFIGLAILTSALSSALEQAAWLAARHVPAWAILLVANAQLLVGFVALFAGPAWPRISWWLFKKRQVAGFARDAEQRVAQLRVAGVTEITALATVLNDANHLYEMARGSAFATAWSPQPRAYWALCERFSERLQALAAVEADPAARLNALQAVLRSHSFDYVAMREDL